MATDATGAPTPLGIPKYNVSVDAPSGLGFNAAMDSIDSIITAKQLPTASGSNKVPVWNGSSWVAQTVPPAALTPGSAGQVLSTDGAGATAWAGGVQKIAEQTLAAQASGIDFSNIPTTFKHLFFTGQVDNAVGSFGFNVRFNNDSASNYSSIELSAVGSSVASTVFGPATVGRVGASWNQGSSGMSVFTLYVPRYANTTHQKRTISEMTGFDGTALNRRSGGTYWSNTSAINRVTFINDAGHNFVVESSISLYGIG